jgi:hypothetical protein
LHRYDEEMHGQKAPNAEGAEDADDASAAAAASPPPPKPAAATAPAAAAAAAAPPPPPQQPRQSPSPPPPTAAEAQQQQPELVPMTPEVAAATAAVNAIDKADVRLWLDAAKSGNLKALEAMHASNPAFLYVWGKGISLGFTGNSALHWAAAKGHVEVGSE